MLNRLLKPFSFRGKARLLNALYPGEGEREAQVFGYRVKLDLQDFIQRSIYLHTFEPVESSLASNYLKKGMSFIDVGANVGYYSLMAASIVGSTGRVIAFEPSQYAFRRLLGTVDENRIKQIIVNPFALSDSAGKNNLYIQDSRLGNHSPSMVPDDHGQPASVLTERLDVYLDEHEIRNIDLMKIDVEGFEPNVIRGAGRYCREGKIGAILCEFNAYWLEANGSSPTLLFEELQKCGYRTDCNFNPAQDFQNLLFTR